jgi:hypothetical protein
MGECGQRSAISPGSILVAYAAYNSTAHQRNDAGLAAGDLRRGGGVHGIQAGEENGAS